MLDWLGNGPDWLTEGDGLGRAAAVPVAGAGREVPEPQPRASAVCTLALDPGAPAVLMRL